MKSPFTYCPLSKSQKWKKMKAKTTLSFIACLLVVKLAKSQGKFSISFNLQLPELAAVNFFYI